MHYKNIILLIILIVLVGLGFRHIQTSKISTSDIPTIEQDEFNNEIIPEETILSRATDLFDRVGLKTNLGVSDIPLDSILNGGPGKDGIPPIHNPIFTSVDERSNAIDIHNTGIVIEGTTINTFYPYAILDWHEIVTDTVDGTPISVTFCPLCGSAIAFEREVNDEELVFGVSGLLWESNLLMYDTQTESLWSQIEGRAVVGDMTGTELEIYPSNIMTLQEAITQYGADNLKVLSTDTGHNRSYGRSPYGNYLEEEETYFPISNKDERLHPKELMYIVNTDTKSVAFKKDELQKQRIIKVETGEEVLTVQVKDSFEINVTDETGRSYPGYHALWFSWASHHQDDGILWKQ